VRQADNSFILIYGVIEINREQRCKKIVLILIASIVAISLLIINIEFFIDTNTSFKTIIDYIGLNQKFAPLIFIGLQILQVVFFFIPGELTQAAGGYLFGSLSGILLSLIGITIGSALEFLIAKNYGDKLLRKILPQKKYTLIKMLVCREKNKFILFVLYVLPGFPKDILGYVSGISGISFKSFIIITSIARLPGIVTSTLLGANLFYDNYVATIYILIMIAIALFFSLTRREKIIKFLK
jgi:uncharacterized membrane protein YdjX (TVP38/TMEM64 family)